MQGQSGNAEGRRQRKEGKIVRWLFRILHSAFCISSRGQALAEYVIIAGLLMASLGILAVFFVTFHEYGGRILALVSSEYP